MCCMKFGNAVVGRIFISINRWQYMIAIAKQMIGDCQGWALWVFFDFAVRSHLGGPIWAVEPLLI